MEHIEFHLPLAYLVAGCNFCINIDCTATHPHTSAPTTNKQTHRNHLACTKCIHAMPCLILLLLLSHTHSIGHLQNAIVQCLEMQRKLNNVGGTDRYRKDKGANEVQYRNEDAWKFMVYIFLPCICVYKFSFGFSLMSTLFCYYAPYIDWGYA